MVPFFFSSSLLNVFPFFFEGEATRKGVFLFLHVLGVPEKEANDTPESGVLSSFKMDVGKQRLHKLR